MSVWRSNKGTHEHLFTPKCLTNFDFPSAKWFTSSPQIPETVGIGQLWRIQARSCPPLHAQRDVCACTRGQRPRGRLCRWDGEVPGPATSLNLAQATWSPPAGPHSRPSLKAQEIPQTLGSSKQTWGLRQTQKSAEGWGHGAFIYSQGLSTWAGLRLVVGRAAGSLALALSQPALAITPEGYRPSWHCPHYPGLFTVAEKGVQVAVQDCEETLGKLRQVWLSTRHYSSHEAPQGDCTMRLWVSKT